MSVMTSAFRASVRQPGDVSPALVVVGRNGGCACAKTLLLLLGGGLLRLKESEALNTIQSCQGCHGDDWNNRFRGVESTDASHELWIWKRSILILDAKGDGFTTEL
jgi:hypothetical protein